MNEFIGWVLFITVNCMTPAPDPDIYVIKGAHPAYGPVQATIVVCEKTWQPMTPNQRQSETQVNYGNLFRTQKLIFRQ